MLHLQTLQQEKEEEEGPRPVRRFNIIATPAVISPVWPVWGLRTLGERGMFSRHDGPNALGSAGVDGPAQKNDKTVLDMLEVQPWWGWLSVIHTVAVFWYTASRGRAFLLRGFLPQHTRIKIDSKCNTTFMCQTSWYQTRGVKCLTLQCLVLGCLCFAFHFVYCKEILAFWRWMAVGIPQGCKLQNCKTFMFCILYWYELQHRASLFGKCMLLPCDICSRPKALGIMCTFLMCIYILCV